LIKTPAQLWYANNYISSLFYSTKFFKEKKRKETEQAKRRGGKNEENEVHSIITHMTEEVELLVVD
jgi:hypothetical protein